MHIYVYPETGVAAKAAAEFLGDRLRRHDDPRRFTLALSGGSTPSKMFEEMRRLTDSARLLNEKSEIFFSDERAVPPDNPQSNYGMAKKTLLDPLDINSSIVFRMRGEADDLNAEAARYEQLIQQATGSSQPSLDLVLLGMGPDGHTASLFPELDLSRLANSYVAAVYVNSLKAHRLTFTLRLINAARTALFLVYGEEKADALKKVLSADTQANILPAGRVEALQTIWIVDRNAAKLLEPDRIRGSLTTC